MKCVFAIKSLAAAGGGAERVFVDIVNGLSAREHEVTVLSYDGPAAKSFYPLASEDCWVRLGIGRTDRPATSLETAQRMLALRHTIAGLKPDVAVGFMHSMFIPLGLALIGSRIPMIASEHIVPIHYKDRLLERLLLRLTPWLARRVTVVSEQAMAAYPPAMRAVMVVIPNPVRVMSDSHADVLGVGRPRKVLLSVGRLTEQKDHATLVDSFSLIADRLPEWDLRIVGEGECRAELQSRIAAAGLQERVSLPGATADIWQEYANAQLYVMPSLYESQGLALVEALQSGLPAVGFADCPGVNELIHAGLNGVLLSGEDRVQALAGALEGLMSDGQARADLVQSRVPAQEKNVPEQVLDRWEELLHATCRASSP
ncbi:MAG: glycosyltransferase family 4 protein [Chloroflexi bacterium]|nr:glycosyltransferase family 4 protein [Chloroflexota bacterium]